MTWAPSYVDAADDLGSYLRITGDVDDLAEMELAVSAASRAVDDATNRQFGLVAASEARIYPAEYRRGRWVVDIDDLMTTTGLVVVVDGTPVTVHQLEPRNAPQKARPWTRLVFTDASEATPSCVGDNVTMTARWGWTAFPDPVPNATLLQAARFFTRRNAPFGVAGSPDQGSEMRLLARVDPDVAVMLRGLHRPRAVG